MSFKIIMMRSVKRPCFTTQQDPQDQDHSVQNQDQDRFFGLRPVLSKIDCLRPHHCYLAVGPFLQRFDTAGWMTGRTRTRPVNNITQQRTEVLHWQCYGAHGQTWSNLWISAGRLKNSQKYTVVVVFNIRLY